jgi:hypothetical protein
MDANGRLYLADASTPVEDLQRAREFFASVEGDEQGALDRLRAAEGDLPVALEGLSAEDRQRIAGLL